MDLSKVWMQLFSLLTILLAVVGTGDSFLSNHLSKRSMRKALKKRGISLHSAMHEIRNKRLRKHLASARKYRAKTGLKNLLQSRISYKECNLGADLRSDCGFAGITKQECAERECCFSEDAPAGVPSCYHSKLTINRRCELDAGANKTECGWPGIRKEQCLAMACCYQPSQETDTWCYNAKVLPIFEGECGVPAETSLTESRIVNGQEVAPHSLPWVVSLQLDGDHFCGGSLINHQWIVSAAHCAPVFDWGYSSGIILGLHSQSSPGGTEIHAQIEKVISHEDYGSANGMDNDIALIKLTQPVHFDDSVSPVCLPQQGEQVAPGQHCYTAGWGTTSSGGDLSNNLLEVSVPIMETEVCNEGDWYGGAVDDTMICAGYEEGGRDSCQGDSGGPLFCLEDGLWELVGVVSWGHGCAFERKPGIYARVSNYIDWIRDEINENS